MGTYDATAVLNAIRARADIVDSIEIKQDLNADDSPYYGAWWKRVILNLHADGSVTWTPGPEHDPMA